MSNLWFWGLIIFIIGALSYLAFDILGPAKTAETSETEISSDQDQDTDMDARPNEDDGGSTEKVSAEKAKAIDAYKAKFTEEDSPGWLAIDDRIEQIHRDQKERHYAANLPFMVGGSDPLDGISVYDVERQTFHRHLVSYGMSNLYYDEDAVGEPYSGFGFEFTMRIAPFSSDEGDPLWATQVMNNIARYQFSGGNGLDENHFIPVNGPIKIGADTDIVGIAFAQDPEMGTINTPHGEVMFLQLVGLTSKEVESLGLAPTVGEVEELLTDMRKTNPLLITDLDRK